MNGRDLLGLEQLSAGRIIGAPLKLARQLFRNAPWLVLLFHCIFLMRIRSFGGFHPASELAAATIGFSFPVASFLPGSAY